MGLKISPKHIFLRRTSSKNLPLFGIFFSISVLLEMVFERWTLDCLFQILEGLGAAALRRKKYCNCFFWPCVYLQIVLQYVILISKLEKNIAIYILNNCIPSHTLHFNPLCRIKTDKFLFPNGIRLRHFCKRQSLKAKLWRSRLYLPRKSTTFCFLQIGITYAEFLPIRSVPLLSWAKILKKVQ